MPAQRQTLLAWQAVNADFRSAKSINIFGSS